MRSKTAQVLAAVCAALVIFGAPAAAAPTSVAVGDTLDAPAIVAAEGGEKHQFPLDLETPYGIFGAFLLVCLILGTAFGIINAVKQLRGDRPQSDGSWRWR